MQETLSCIYEKAGALTRRSAGLPSMMIGILISSDNVSFDAALRQIQNISRQPLEQSAVQVSNHLPQVHALNCLKEICTNTHLGSATEPYLADIIILTSECLESKL